jgi:hypothetical protein
MATRQNLACITFLAMVFVASHKRSVHALLPKALPLVYA